MTEKPLHCLEDIPGLVHKTFCTNDGVRLHYVDIGCGPCVVLLHGFGIDCTFWTYTLAALSEHFRVLALDQRGHGQSGKPDYGMKIARLACDVREWLEHENISCASFVGHSMGCAVIWSMIEQFGQSGVERLAFVDEPPMVLGDSGWSDEERRNAGAFVTNIHAFSPYPQTTGHVDDAAWPLKPRLPDTPYSKALHHPAWERPPALRRLMFNHACQDWRDLLPRITRPVLIFTGEHSDWLQSQRWMQSVMPDTALSCFPTEESGDHDLFFKNPIRFNRELLVFLSLKEEPVAETKSATSPLL